MVKAENIASEYQTSKSEMLRRKKAFVSLEVSIYLSIIVFSFSIIVSYPVLSIPSLAILAVLMICFWLQTNSILYKQSYIKVCISNHAIEKKFINSYEKYSLSKIDCVKIKRTSKGSIREIKFNIVGSNPFYINGLEDFEDFNNNLLLRVPNAEVKNFMEPFDLDHLLFYPILGTIIGIITSLIIRLLILLNDATLKYFRYSLACFVIFVGIFFILKKPIRGRYGEKSKISDFMICFFFIGAGLLIYLT